jgi:hypothetical protein
LFTGRFALVYWLVVAGIFVLVVPGITGWATKLFEADAPAADWPLAAFAGPEESVCECFSQPARSVIVRTNMVKDMILVLIVFIVVIWLFCLRLS